MIDTNIVGQWSTWIIFVLLWCQLFSSFFFFFYSTVSILFLHDMYRLILPPAHTHRHKQAIEKVKSDKSSISSLFVVLERQQIEKHGSLPLYIMKFLTRQVNRKKRKVIENT